MGVEGLVGAQVQFSYAEGAFDVAFGKAMWPELVLRLLGFQSWMRGCWRSFILKRWYSRRSSATLLTKQAVLLRYSGWSVSSMKVVRQVLRSAWCETSSNRWSKHCGVSSKIT